MLKSLDLFDAYFSYTEKTEPPKIYHRWCMISGIGALLGRKIYIPFGHTRIFPNLFTMLIGTPGARKTTAINILRKTIEAAGYETFAAEKTTKEKFLLDLEGEEEEDSLGVGAAKSGKYDRQTEKNLWSLNETFQEPKEVFIAADEFNDFAGSGNLEFYTTLGKLWDWDNERITFRQRVKNSKSVSIFQPTVSILAGNTQENFARAFPVDTIGQGFLSRLILIYGTKTEARYTIPPTPDIGDTEAIVTLFRDIRGGNFSGAVSISEKAFALLDRIYKEWTDLPDVRFLHYSNRRLTQLLKLCLIFCAASFRKEIDEEIIIYANTVLSHAEILMPKALGEFGKSKNSDITHKIMNILTNAHKPLSAAILWKEVHNDLERPIQLQEVLQGLQHADKIQWVTSEISQKQNGWLAKKMPPRVPQFVDWSLLTEEEREMI